MSESLIEERLAEPHPDMECPECGDRMTWFSHEPQWILTYAEDADGAFVTVSDVSTGRYSCHNFGGCEAAPG